MEFYEFISSEINKGDITTRDELQRRKMALARELRLDHIPGDTEILSSGTVDEKYHSLLKIKPTRTISGVAVVAAMTSPERCPHGKCIYCPGGVDNNSPQAYTGYEPAAMRGRDNGYDSYRIVFNRLKQLETIGHDTSKIDLIIMGGTFTARTKEYQQEYIKGCFDAMNRDISPSLEESIHINESTGRRCIGLTVETKPDWFMEKEIDLALDYGTTKVELGVQVLHEESLRLNGRGHGIEEVVRSTRLSRDAGLKIVYHVMPGMYGTGIEDDIKSFNRMIGNPNFKPDMLKIYPTLVVKGTSLYRLWKQGKYVPPDTEAIADLVAHFMEKMPPWIRVQRMQRDIPVKFIEAGVKRSDIRNIVDSKLKARGVKTMEIRSREIGISHNTSTYMELVRRDYNAGLGKEIFLSYENEDSIFGFLRLRKPSPEHHREEMDGSSVIREIKVLGEVVPVGEHTSENWQHKGIGKKLLYEAERITKDEFGLDRILVISGVGVREYFRKQRYVRVGPYMGKPLA